MDFFKKLGLENKIIAGFGLAAVAFSFITGLISGVSLGSIIFRLFFVLIIFAGLGVAIVFVLKKYTPELFDALQSSDDVDPESMQIDSDGIKEESYAADSEVAADKMSDADGQGSANESDKGEFQELTSKDFQSVSDSDLGLADAGTAAGGSGKLGKHVIVDEKFGKYEPKIMAEAVRTMMSKEEE